MNVRGHIESFLSQVIQLFSCKVRGRIESFLSQVLEMLLVVLHESHREGDDKWKRLSRQVTDMVLPLLAKQQVTNVFSVTTTVYLEGA